MTMRVLQRVVERDLASRGAEVLGSAAAVVARRGDGERLYAAREDPAARAVLQSEMGRELLEVILRANAAGADLGAALVDALEELEAGNVSRALQVPVAPPGRASASG